PSPQGPGGGVMRRRLAPTGLAARVLVPAALAARFLVPAALAALLLAPAARAQDRVMRVSLNTELQILDPVVVTINATRVFAYMVFDQLVGIDAEGRYQPQMLEGWEVSDDRLTWRFRLREGLEWHDGTPVTAEDCVASLRRWAKREPLGAQLIDATREI